MKRFLIGFAAMALVITVSASEAKAERGRRRGYSQVTYAVPATYVVPTYVAPVTVAPAAAPDFPPIGRPAAVVSGRGRGHVDRIAHEVLHVPPYRPDRGNSTVRPAFARATAGQARGYFFSMIAFSRPRSASIIVRMPCSIIEAGTNPSALVSPRFVIRATDPVPDRCTEYDTVPVNGPSTIFSVNACGK